MLPARSSIITNFGQNVEIKPTAYCLPCDEAGVLDVLTRHRGEKIRAIGSLHSWSEAPAAEGVVIDLRNLDQVTVERRNGGYWATIAAGCQIKRVLDELDRHDVTLPTLGLISEQTIAGATATATHGSGRSSLSNYLAEVRVAMYDRQTGEPVIRTFREGPELLAARTSLGLMGIVVSVGLWCRPQYMIEEVFRLHDSLDAVLIEETDFPLQQFFTVPWLWKYLAQHRREVDAPRSRSAGLYRWYWFLGIDIGMHVIFQALVKLFGGEGAVKFYFRRISMWLAIRGWRVVDKSQAMLVMEHELFRHIEIELFVARSRLETAHQFIREVIECFSGNIDALSGATQDRLRQVGMLDELLSAIGSYTHHYVICNRRVLPDEALISMTSDLTEDSYAISFISYARPTERAGFFRFAKFLSRSMLRLFDARPHWGKYYPLEAKDVEHLYPHMPQFRDVCELQDPTGIFCNAWANRVIFDERVEH